MLKDGSSKLEQEEGPAAERRGLQQALQLDRPDPLQFGSAVH